VFLSGARFDPLHDAETEQYLYDQLEGWLEDLSRTDQLQATVNYQGNEFSAEFSRLDLAARLSERWQPLLQRVRSLLTADTPAALQLPASLDRFPGLLKALAELSGVEVFTQEAGAAARGAGRRSVLAAARDGLRLVTALPWDEAAAQPPVRSSSSSGVEQPTHLLAGAHAYRLNGRQAFFIGTELVAGGYGLQLDNGVAGVSRQHCSIQQDDGRLVLTDHSRFGTQLNGHGIDGSAVLQAGDVIAVGSPPREFRLIAEVGPDGA